MSAALSVLWDLAPRDLINDNEALTDLHNRLERIGHYIPYRRLKADRPPKSAQVYASSEQLLSQPTVTGTVNLSHPRMVSLPLESGTLHGLDIWVDSPSDTNIEWRLYGADKEQRWIPGEELRKGAVTVPAFVQGRWVHLPIGLDSESSGYVHIAFVADAEDALLGVGDMRPLGPLTWKATGRDIDEVPIDDREAMGWQLRQLTEEWGDSGAYPFSIWRRDGHGWGGHPGPAIAFKAKPAQSLASASAVLDAWERPTPSGVHAWVGAETSGNLEHHKFLFDEPEWIEVRLEEPTYVDRLDTYFNSDVDRHLANLWYSHPPGERAMSTVIADFSIEILRTDDAWHEITSVTNNHRRRHSTPVSEVINGWRVICRSTHGERYASIMDFRMRRQPDDGSSS